MSLASWWDQLAGHSMRAYYLPMAAGVGLIVSAFLPWFSLGADHFGGVPDTAGLWVLGLGVAAVVLAVLSLITRKNSRHPLLVVGLAAFGIMFLAWRVMGRMIAERAWVASQAEAIVSDGAPAVVPEPTTDIGLYLGLAASLGLVLFGLTIVVKRVARPYADPEDDDI